MYMLLEDHDDFISSWWMEMKPLQWRDFKAKVMEEARIPVMYGQYSGFPVTYDNVGDLTFYYNYIVNWI